MKINSPSFNGPTVVPAPNPAQDHDLQTRREIPDLVALGFSERRNPAMVAATWPKV